MRLNRAFGDIDCQESQTEPFAKPHDILVTQLPTAVFGNGNCHIDSIAESLAFDRLKDQAEREGKLEFDDDGRLVAAHGDNVTCADLGLHLVALGFEIGFDWGI